MLSFVFQTFVVSIFAWPLKTGFTVLHGSPFITIRLGSGKVSRVTKGQFYKGIKGK